MNGVARLALSLALTSLACSRSLAPQDFPADAWVVERSGPREVTIVWNGQGEAPDSRVFVSAQPSPEANGVAAAELRDGRATLRELPPDARPYFTLVAPGESRGVVVAERVLPLEGAHNFRDLGGYATADGRRVRWGRVFRSDNISELTAADLDYLGFLGLRLVCDFRSPAERAGAPDRLPSPAPQVAELAISDEQIDPTVLREAIMSGELGDFDFAQILTDGNRSFASTFAGQYRELFDRLGEAEGMPALLHCTAGKDRTGFGSALVLLALGVPENTVFDDYLLTNAPPRGAPNACSGSSGCARSGAPTCRASARCSRRGASISPRAWTRRARTLAISTATCARRSAWTMPSASG